MAERRLALPRKVSLEGIAEGWGSDCYAEVQQSTVQERLEYIKTKVVDDEAIIKAQMDYVVKHFRRGKVMVLGDGEQPELTDMTEEDIRSSMEISNRLFNEINGMKYDPKASPAEAGNERVPENASNTTATT